MSCCCSWTWTLWICFLTVMDVSLDLATSADWLNAREAADHLSESGAVLDRTFFFVSAFVADDSSSSLKSENVYHQTLNKSWSPKTPLLFVSKQVSALIPKCDVGKQTMKVQQVSWNPTRDVVHLHQFKVILSKYYAHMVSYFKAHSDGVRNLQ